MLVKNWMSKKVITIDRDASMRDAIRLLKENNIQMLPVMKKTKLVGIVTDRDLKKASASDANSLEIHELKYLIEEIKVEEIMTKDPVTIPFNYTLEETAEVLLSHKISGVPVVDHEKNVIGVITEKDLFRALMSLTSFEKRGIQFAFQTEDRPGSIKEIADIFRKYGSRIASILSSCDSAQSGYRNVYFRVYEADRSKLQQLKAELNGQSKVLYMVDLLDNTREIYASS
jgi:acetoin utilization protein AcuB